ncbi:hypothetical protein [Variovorax boronicumulans]|uniref:hypothetical protein n=1 Tax=Variovorax boronicumulans TaxID=436515 RepID=UPI0012E4596F|nr:hypothetical protein [Variovorax boronicumulans]GER21273.1 hypothetical protein VCH24_63200 [Variovorax boronicumulans]
MSHWPYGPSLLDQLAGHREAVEARRQAAAAAMQERPRARTSTAIVVTKHPISATVEPIAVVDFYEKEDSDVQR